MAVHLRQKKLKDNTISISLDFIYNGQRKWEAIQLFLTGDKKKDAIVLRKAEAIRWQREVDLATGAYQTKKIKPNMSFIDYYKKITEERPEYTRRAQLLPVLEIFNKDDWRRTPFSAINESWWNEFKKYLIEHRHYQQTTISTSFYMLKAVLNRAVRDGIIFENPFKDFREKRPKSMRTYLTLDELIKFVSVPTKYNEVKVAFLFCCYTGLRYGDVCDLRKRDIRNNVIVKKMEKTKEVVYIPLHEEAVRLMKNFETLEPDERIFNMPSKSIVHPVVKSLAAAAGITKDVTFHT